MLRAHAGGRTVAGAAAARVVSHRDCRNTAATLEECQQLQVLVSYREHWGMLPPSGLSMEVSLAYSR